MTAQPSVDRSRTCVFDGATMATTVLRVRDVEQSVRWYVEQLGLQPLHVGSDGPNDPIATLAIAGSMITLWQLPNGETRCRADNDRNTYVVVVVDEDLDGLRRTLAERGVEVGELQRSTNNEYFQFYDADDNLLELARPTGPLPI